MNPNAWLYTHLFLCGEVHSISVLPVFAVGATPACEVHNMGQHITDVRSAMKP
jgi:hypothetical protein